MYVVKAEYGDMEVLEHEFEDECRVLAEDKQVVEN